MRLAVWVMVWAAVPVRPSRPPAIVIGALATANGLPLILDEVTALRRLSTVAEAEVQGLKPPMVSEVFAETPVAAGLAPVVTGFIRNSPRPVLVRPKAPVRAWVVGAA